MDPQPGPSGLCSFDDDPGDISSLMEATLAEGDAAQLMEVEPELYIDSVDGDDSFGDTFAGAEWAAFDPSSAAEGAVSAAEANYEPEEHMPAPGPSIGSTNGRGAKIQLGPNCPICGQQMHKQHSRDHVSW